MNLFRVTILFWWCLCAGVTAAGQALRPAQDTRLDARVMLPAGKTTLKTLASLLSEQTGLTITAAVYLEERELTMQTTGASAKAVLQAICELNDWTLLQPKPGAFTISRRPTRKPRDLMEMAQMLGPLLPPDVRRYIGLGESDEEKLVGASPDELRSLTPFNRSTVADRHVRQRIRELEIKEREAFCSAIDAKLVSGEKFPCTKLDTPMRDRLGLICALQTFRLLDPRALAGRVLPFEADMLNDEIRVNGGAQMLIGTPRFAADGTRLPFTGLGGNLNAPYNVPVGVPGGSESPTARPRK